MFRLQVQISRYYEGVSNSSILHICSSLCMFSYCTELPPTYTNTDQYRGKRRLRGSIVTNISRPVRLCSVQMSKVHRVMLADFTHLQPQTHTHTDKQTQDSHTPLLHRCTHMQSVYSRTAASSVKWIHWDHTSGMFSRLAGRSPPSLTIRYTLYMKVLDFSSTLSNVPFVLTSSSVSKIKTFLLFYFTFCPFLVL